MEILHIEILRAMRITSYICSSSPVLLNCTLSSRSLDMFNSMINLFVSSPINFDHFGVRSTHSHPLTAVTVDVVNVGVVLVLSRRARVSRLYTPLNSSMHIRPSFKAIRNQLNHDPIPSSNTVVSLLIIDETQISTKSTTRLLGRMGRATKLHT